MRLMVARQRPARASASRRTASQSPPASGVGEQMRTWTPSVDVVAKQNVAGNAAQSASTLQPGVHVSPVVGFSTQAFGRFRALPPLAPRPAQSDERVHGFVHHAARHERPALQAFAAGSQGSPTPL